jgi:hypothetical protein
VSSFQEIAQKKIAGVPVLYLAGAFVAVLAVVAWRMKPSAAPPAEPSPSDGGTDAQLDENGHADGTNPYAGYSGNGTVIVAPSPPVPEPEPDTIDTNDEWVREGAEWLVANKNVPGPAAHTALTKFVEGRSRSITEGQWVEWVIKEKGFPPDPFTETPAAASVPAAPAAPIKPTGYRGYGWAKADGRTTGAQYAAKYKIPATQFYSWNPGQPRVPKKGVWLKVRAASNPLTGYKGA